MTQSTARAKTGAEFLADKLDKENIDHVFFVDAILRETLVELEKRGIRRILAHSEKSAAYMADGYARASGKLGVCMAQSVGAANLGAGLQDAYLNRTPVLAISGKKSPVFQNRNAYQEVPHIPFYESVTKFQASVDQIEQLPILLNQAIREAQTGTRRPVFLDFDHYRGSAIEEAEIPLSADLYEQYVSSQVSEQIYPSKNSLKSAEERLSQAKRPMIVVGVGADAPGIDTALRTFSETHQVPIATSVGARSLIETSHPLHIGVVGTYSAPFANELLYEADLVIYVGCHTSDQISCDWKIPAPGTDIIQIDIDSAELGRNYPNTIGITGTPSVVLSELSNKSNVDRHEWVLHCQQTRDAWFSQYEEPKSDAKPIRAERLASDLSDAMPDDAIVVADTGFSATWTVQLTEFRKNTQTYLRAAGSLGWAFPASIGAKCAQMHRPVICFSGDGAMHYHSSELETLRRWNIPLVVVVNNNSSLGQGLRSVKQLYEGREGELDDLVNFHPVNFADLAEVYGVAGLRVEDPAEIIPTIRKAVEMNAPVVVDVVTDPDCNPCPAWVPND